MAKGFIRVRALPLGLVAAAAVVLALAACGEKKAQQSADVAARNAAASKAEAQSAGQQTNTMVEAPTLGKATAPVRLKFEIMQRPVAGQTITVQLALIPGSAAQSLTLQLGDPPGLVLADHSDRPFGAVQPDQVYRAEISASAPVAGVFFLSLTATMVRDSLTETRNFSIPIIVSAG